MEVWLARAQTFDAFLSHSHRDEAIVREVKEELERAGVRCWLDEEQLRFGDRLVLGLQAAVEASQCVLLFWSRHSQQSEWVQEEWTAVFRHGRIIPVLLDDTEQPVFLRNRVALDVRSNRLEAVARLAAQLGAKAAGACRTEPALVRARHRQVTSAELGSHDGGLAKAIKILVVA